MRLSAREAEQVFYYDPGLAIRVNYFLWGGLISRHKAYHREPKAWGAVPPAMVSGKAATGRRNPAFLPDLAD
uniref:Uncharacterized protein n=1 Tax=Candidatus Kentrum sp. FM TaxID=2126340 RepID=A0A450T3C2_9GAMM|nr:MAG: hypothetical protein BECKFM1743C_GA0114222_102851 [Candidatus Kentron sp. FM]